MRAAWPKPSLWSEFLLKGDSCTDYYCPALKNICHRISALLPGNCIFHFLPNVPATFFKECLKLIFLPAQAVMDELHRSRGHEIDKNVSLYCTCFEKRDTIFFFNLNNGRSFHVCTSIRTGGGQNLLSRGWRSLLEKCPGHNNDSQYTI